MYERPWTHPTQSAWYPWDEGLVWWSVGVTSWNHWEKRVECSITLRNNSAFALQNGVLKEAPVLLIIRTDHSRTYRIVAITGNPQLSKIHIHTSTKCCHYCQSLSRPMYLLRWGPAAWVSKNLLLHVHRERLATDTSLILLKDPPLGRTEAWNWQAADAGFTSRLQTSHVCIWPAEYNSRWEILSKSRKCSSFLSCPSRRQSRRRRKRMLGTRLPFPSPEVPVSAPSCVSSL